jgi:hypothetical protein
MLYPLLMRPSEPNLDCSGRAATYKGLDYGTDWVSLVNALATMQPCVIIVSSSPSLLLCYAHRPSLPIATVVFPCDSEQIAPATRPTRTIRFGSTYQRN